MADVTGLPPSLLGHICGMNQAGSVVTEVVGRSNEGVDEAIRDGMRRIGHALDWFEVTGVRSTVLGSAQRFQVDLRAGVRQAA